MDKNFQIAILQKIAPNYPSHSADSVPDLLKMAPGNTEEEKERSLVAHLKALERYGYIEGLNFRLSVDGFSVGTMPFKSQSRVLLRLVKIFSIPTPISISGTLF